MLVRPADLASWYNCRVDARHDGWWTTPASGFNTVIQIPLHKFEVWEDETKAGEDTRELVANTGLTV